MDRGAWWVTVHGVAKSRKRQNTHTAWQRNTCDSGPFPASKGLGQFFAHFGLMQSFVLVFILVQILVNICEATKQEKELFQSR